MHTIDRDGGIERESETKEPEQNAEPHAGAALQDELGTVAP